MRHFELWLTYNTVHKAFAFSVLKKGGGGGFTVPPAQKL